jgi:hypothetical protein
VKYRQTNFIFYTLRVILLLVLIIPVSCDTDNNIDNPYKNYFVKYYGGNGNQSGIDLIINSDGTMLLLGNWTNGATNKIYMVKTTAEGRILWEKWYGSATDKAIDIEPTLDGNFIILSTYEAGVNNTNVKLIRVAVDGAKIDSVMYGYSANENAQSVTPLIDGGFIVTGATEYDSTVLPNPDPNDVSDIFHYRCNQNLVFSTSNWAEQYGPGSFDAGTKVIQQGATEFYVFGYSNERHGGNPTGKFNLVYYSLNAQGLNSAPSRMGASNQNTRLSCVIKAPEPNGGYFLISTQSGDKGSSLHIAKLRSPLRFNAVDDEQLNKEVIIPTAQLEAVSAAVSFSSPQGFLLLANEMRGPDNKNIWISKMDQEGTVHWSSSFGAEGNDTAAAIAELPDGKIIVLGTMRISNQQSKMALLKLNSNGQLLN